MSRKLLGLFFTFAGVMHFVIPRAYERVVPPGFGDPKLMVQVSGVAEIAGGLGVLPRRTRRLSGLGLVALLLAVFPANVFMAIDPESTGAEKIPRPLLYARLPLQALMIRWVLRATRRERAVDAGIVS
ncbi:MAG TPA: hypothetical protein VHX88_15135 [Solirubrobacteraceae bacterium]|jgi:uncharacterized membrane protein|nr:hypothetical protein [Solirubrobacteraceae bacterium]